MWLFFFSSRRRHTRCLSDWSSDVCSSDLAHNFIEKAGGLVTELATFGAGCFWGVEVTFRNTPGVKDAIVGYLGGTLANPTYRDVCTGRTGHAEVVQVKYDPAELSYDKLLDVFWEIHEPTTLTRQGPAVGTE